MHANQARAAPLLQRVRAWVRESEESSGSTHSLVCAEARAAAALVLPAAPRPRRASGLVGG
eukprot:3656567-Rhodomonas_salina.1